ncbi:MAG: SDR family oxidoreductase [Myxococcales bacterium]|nr:SDR family oxidoreductase [Myxococcales bacterium]
MATYAVTGASRGIGLELCRQLRARGDAVIALCRRGAPALAEIGARIEEGVDVGDPAAIAALGERLADVEIDGLINNAGILSFESLEELDVARIRRQFEINALGPLLVSAALRPRMRAGSKIAIITSRMGSLSDNSSGGSYGYRMSKAAVNAAGVSLARDLHGEGIAVALIHPGWVRTEMTQGRGLADPPEAAAGILARIDALTLAESGGFWHANGERLPW